MEDKKMRMFAIPGDAHLAERNDGAAKEDYEEHDKSTRPEYIGIGTGCYKKRRLPTLS